MKIQQIITLLVVLVIGYYLGVKWPSWGAKVGL